MMARLQSQGLDLVDLRTPGAPPLDTVLREERLRWQTLLHWDFGPSSELVLRYAGVQALDGLALVDDGEAVGYTYWVAEDHKGLIGDLYVRDAWRSPANENRLMEGALRQLRRSPWVERVEAQLLQMSLRGSQLQCGGRPPARYPRHFMLARVPALGALRPLALQPQLRLEHWGPRWLEQASDLIAHVYRDHIDSEINDQYHSARGARRFLQNIIQYPGCGYFSHTASWVAVNPANRLVGMVLSSMVAPRVGHIAQLCAHASAHGAGYELLRQALGSLREQGAEEVSLTVTASNERAIRLYARCGFQAVYQFDALVWSR